MSETTELDRPVNKIDIAEALKLRLNNKLTFQEIGDKFGVTRQAVHLALSRFTDFLEDAELIDGFKEAKTGLYDIAEIRLLQSIVDKDAISKGSLNNRAYALRQVHDINQANKGLATTQGGVTINIRVCAGAAPGEVQIVSEQAQEQQVIDVEAQDVVVKSDNGGT